MIETVPVKHTASINRTILPETTPDDWKFLYVDISSVDSTGVVTLPEEMTQFGDAPSRARRLAPVGATVVSTVRTYLRSIGRVPPSGDQLVFSTGFATLEALPGVDPDFLYFACRADEFVDEVVARSTGVSYPAINPSDLGSVPVRLPALEDQRRVADFLDDQTTRIDQIIAGRRGQSVRVLEHQSETRRVAIRGLDEAADEPSDIGGWLGRIGSEFAVRRIGALSRVYAGAGFPHEHQGRGKGDLPFMKVSDLANSDSIGRVMAAANYVDGALATTLGAKPAPAGTIVFPKVGAALLTNRRAVLGVQAVFDNNVMGLDFLAADKSYMLHVLRDLDLAQFANPGPVPSVNESTVKDILVPLPTTQKQRQIADHLDQVAHDAQATVAILGESIALLQQFKRSLISAAVSGEIDVSTASGRGVPA